MAALGACVSFVQLLETDQEKLTLQHWIPAMFEVEIGFILLCYYFIIILLRTTCRTLPSKQMILCY
jgi:hypothetical protein